VVVVFGPSLKLSVKKGGGGVVVAFCANYIFETSL
jgi:hypothetical protein